MVGCVLWLAMLTCFVRVSQVCMALFRPCPGGGECPAADQEHNELLESIELGFLIVFTLEVLVKLVALAGKFFTDGWNVLDFVIVGSGYLVFIFPDFSSSTFRTIRVLRPLRSIGMMPGVRLLIDALIRSLPGLSAVGMLILFVFAIFGVLGVQIFGGTLDNHCVPVNECQPAYVEGVGAAAALAVNTSATWAYLEYGACMTDDDCIQTLSWQEDEHTMVCREATLPEAIPLTTLATGEYGFCRDDPETPYTCENRPDMDKDRLGYTCVPVTEPYHHGATSFNNIGRVMLILFQLCTTEGWTTIMIPLLDTNSQVTVYVFFALALVSMSFFLVNFVVAQMVVAFSRAVEQQDDAKPPAPTLFDELWRRVRACICGGTSSMTTDVWAMRAMFNKFDEDGSGYLDEEEVKGLSEELGIAVTLREMDESGSGEIKYPQFERWWKMRSTFEKFDEDGSNSLDQEEVNNLVKTLGLHTDFQDCIMEMDQNEDGNISYEEFVSWWSIRHRFEELDISMDDSLSYEELEGLVDLGVERLLIDTMLDCADTNMDGKVDFHEFMLWWQLHRMFERFDKDKSWELEASELYELGKALKMPDLKVVTINPRKTEKHGISFKEMSQWWLSEGKDMKDQLLILAKGEIEEPKNMRYLVQSSVFTTVVLGAVCANFAVLALDHHNMNPDHAALLEHTNVLFTLFFAVEMVLKWIGLGLADYLNDQFNVLDMLIVFISIAELVSTGDGPLSSFRTLRLLRVARSFKVFTAVDSMRRLLDATMRSGAAILNFAILLETFHIIFALVGLHLFGDTLESPSYDAPGRFDSFYTSYLTCFQVLTRENWHELLYVTSNTHGWAGFFFFASLITLGNFVIVSLFLGNLLHSLQIVFMAEAKRIKRKTQSKTVARVPGKRFIPGSKGEEIQTTSILSIAFQGEIRITADMEDEDKERLAALMIQRAWLRKYYNSMPTEEGPKTAETSLGIFGRENGLRMTCVDITSKKWFEGLMLVFIIGSSIMLAFEHPEREVPGWILAFDGVVAFVFLIECLMKVIAAGLWDAEESYLSSGWQALDLFVVVVTIIGFFDKQYRPMRILRAFRTIRPLREVKSLLGLRVITEAMIASMIPVAIVGAIAAFGCGIFAVALVALQKGKLYSCEVDVCTASQAGLVSTAAAELSGGASYAGLTQAGLIATCVEAGEWSGDPIHAREACEGAEYSQTLGGLCTYNAAPDCGDPECYLTFDECDAAGGEWVNADQNFNHIFAALLTLFELATLEDWQGVMYSSIDTTEIAVNATLCNDVEMSCSQTFEREYRGNLGIGGLFIAFILVGAFFFLNLFLGVVANAISTVDTKAHDKTVKQTEGTNNTVYIISSVQAITAEGAYYAGIRKPCLRLVSSKAWDISVGLAIVMNIVVMMTETADQGDAMYAMQQSANVFFTLFFAVEMVLKLLAYNPKRCFRDLWNVLDLLIVIVSVVEISIEFFGNTEATGEAVIEPTLFRTFKIFRLTRLLKLVPHSEGLQLIVSPPPTNRPVCFRTSEPAKTDTSCFGLLALQFRTFLEAMPMVSNVGILLAIVFFTYSVLAVQMFGLVQPSDGEMSSVMNFTDFGRAWWTLFVLSTGEHWNAYVPALLLACSAPYWRCWLCGSLACVLCVDCSIMHELMAAELAPAPHLVGFFFLSFTVLCVFLVINLFVSVVVVAVQKNEEQAWAYKKAGDSGDHGEQLERQLACFPPLTLLRGRHLADLLADMMLPISRVLSHRAGLEPHRCVRPGVGGDRHDRERRDEVR